MSLSAKIESGYVFQTNDFVKEENIPHYSSLALKYELTSRGDSWQDIAYGMPYFGIGAYTATFYQKDLGIPISIFLVQGARIAKITPRILFQYEFNLGFSTNWKAYDRFDNPNNIAVGSSDNIHVAGSLYFKFLVSKHWDLNLGASITHFSNGATRMPNKGLNLGTPYIELSYKFNEPEEKNVDIDLTPPKIEKRIDHNFSLILSSRQIYHSLVETGLTSQYINYDFRVWGFSYAPMYVSSYKYKWGLSLDLIYDESGGATAKREQHPEDLQYYDRVKLGKTKERFDLGVSARGEIVMPYFSFFANLGYDIVHGNKNDLRFYQIMGVKVNLYENVFGTFGIRATNFSRAQFIFWSAGYTLKGKPFKNNEPKIVN